MALSNLDESNFDLQLIKQKLKKSLPLKWVFTGDSITHGAKHTHGFRDYSEIFDERIRWEMGRYNDVIINTGISGNNARDILDNFDWRVSQFNPNIVSLMIGMNDCTACQSGYEMFRGNLIEFIRRIRQIKAIPLLNTPNAICKNGYNGSREDLTSYVEIIKNVAAENNVELIDHYSTWHERFESIEPKGYAQEYLMDWLSDSLHPNEYGHRAFANLLFKTLDIYDISSECCKLFVPNY